MAADSADSSSYRSIVLVLESWDQARQKPDFEEEVGTNVLLAMFQLDPRIKEIFGYSITFKPTKRNVKKLSLQHMVRMLNFMNAALVMECPPQVLFSMLEDVGRRHVRYGCLPQFIPIMGQAFISAMKQRLGKAYWNDDLESAWLEVYKVLSEHIVKGMEEAMKNSK